MNKPAAKEPSMDEILSSIRQIIADEDDGDVAAALVQSTADEAVQAEDDQDEPMALSPEQLVPEAEPVEEPISPPLNEDTAEDENDLSMADEAAFAPVEQSGPDDVDSLANMLADAEADQVEEPDGAAEPEIVLADDIGFDVEDEDPTPEPEMPQAAPMPDPDLSRDVAEKLLEPTTTAASKHAFNKLNQLSIGTGDVTIENMVRDMLRPMLKEWLDENLPGVVEKLVEREIERISRGS